MSYNPIVKLCALCCVIIRAAIELGNLNWHYIFGYKKNYTRYCVTNHKHDPSPVTMVTSARPPPIDPSPSKCVIVLRERPLANVMKTSDQ